MSVSGTAHAFQSTPLASNQLGGNNCTFFNVLKWKQRGMGVRLKCTEQGFDMKEKWKCVQSEHLMWKYWKTVSKKDGCEKCPE
jgi:predicted DNA-binding protein (MmcQ/YjbR family)